MQSGKFNGLNILGTDSLNLVKKPVPPAKNRPSNIFHRESLNKATALHDVYLARKNNPRHGKPISTYYVKIVNPHHDQTDSPMPVLEAIISNYYELLYANPEDVARMRAHYQANMGELRYNEISSKEIAGFKSAVKDPLKAEDLIIDKIACGMLSVERMEEIDKALRKENIFVNPARRDEEFFSISAGDILNYRLVKGLAIGLTTSYILQDDDISRNNISKDGKRLDFDMSLWPILYQYKDSLSFVRNQMDRIRREPSKDKFKVSAWDIQRFPILQDASPYYWPTSKAPLLSSYISDNPFSEADNALYSKLATHPVFIYHKYKTFLKFLLTEPEMYKRLALLHVMPNYKLQHHPHEPAADLLKNHLAARLNEIRSVLLSMPDFRNFLENHGESAYQLIEEEWSARNQRMQIKIAKHYPAKPSYHPGLIIPTTQIRENFRNLCEESKKLSRQATQSFRFFEGFKIRDEFKRSPNRTPSP